jgi:hypothetical protein
VDRFFFGLLRHHSSPVACRCRLFDSSTRSSIYPFGLFHRRLHRLDCDAAVVPRPRRSPSGATTIAGLGLAACTASSSVGSFERTSLSASPGICHSASPGSPPGSATSSVFYRLGSIFYWLGSVFYRLGLFSADSRS